MKNYFENQKIHWNAFAPKDIVFKSNNLTKKLLPAENLLSYTTKGDRDRKMCKKTGGKEQLIKTLTILTITIGAERTTKQLM